MNYTSKEKENFEAIAKTMAISIACTEAEITTGDGKFMLSAERLIVLKKAIYLDLLQGSIEKSVVQYEKLIAKNS